MTECPGGRLRGMTRHEAGHVEARLVIPWGQGPLRLDVVHVCDKWGCPQRLVEWAEPARDPMALLRRLLGPRGMIRDDPPHPGPAAPPAAGAAVNVYGVPHDPEYLPCATGVCAHAPEAPQAALPGPRTAEEARSALTAAFGPEAMAKGARDARSACYGGPGAHLEPCRCRPRMTRVDLEDVLGRPAGTGCPLSVDGDGIAPPGRPSP